MDTDKTKALIGQYIEADETKALIGQFVDTPREDREGYLLNLSQEQRKSLREGLNRLLELLGQREAALQKQLSIVEARGEQLRDNLAIVASFVRAKGTA